MSTQPIAVRVTRYRCPHCPRSYSAKARAVAHIGRCWYNPAARGCKTCRHFIPAVPGEYDTGYPGADEACERGVSLLGESGTQSGPIMGCPLWEALR